LQRFSAFDDLRNKDGEAKQHEKGTAETA